MNTVLVTYASRMGSTREIAEAVADELRQTDHVATSAQPGDYSDWAAIRAWGYAIGFELHAYLDQRPQRRHDLYHPLGLLPSLPR